MTVPEGVLSTRSASLMLDSNGLWAVALWKGVECVRYDSFDSREQAQRLVDAWTQNEENPEIP